MMLLSVSLFWSYAKAFTVLQVHSFHSPTIHKPSAARPSCQAGGPPTRQLVMQCPCNMLTSTRSTRFQLDQLGLWQTTPQKKHLQWQHDIVLITNVSGVQCDGRSSYCSTTTSMVAFGKCQGTAPPWLIDQLFLLPFCFLRFFFWRFGAFMAWPTTTAPPSQPNAFDKMLHQFQVLHSLATLRPEGLNWTTSKNISRPMKALG